MRLLKILLLSTALAAFGAGTALAAPPQLAAKTPGDADKPTTTKKRVVAKKIVKKKVVAHKHVKKKVVKKKIVMAKVKKKPTPDTERAPGDPPPGSNPN